MQKPSLKFAKDLAGKFNEKGESFTDWLQQKVAEKAEWGSLDNNEEVVWQTFFPSNISSVDGWIVYKPDVRPKKLEKKLQHDSIRWNEKRREKRNKSLASRVQINRNWVGVVDHIRVSLARAGEDHYCEMDGSAL